MVTSAKFRRSVLALLPFIWLAGAAYAASEPAASSPEVKNLPGQKDKPPLSEEEIFPHILPQGKKPSAAAKPPAAMADDDGLSAAQKRAKEQDRLFAQLKRAADPKKADSISRAVSGLWAQSGSETIDLLMYWANKEIGEKNYAIALDFLDNVVALAPDYAEGWMRRASVHLMTNDVALAMAEMQRVLQLEPRQYNAMLQIGAVMEMTGRPEQALQAYEKALALYPQMGSAQRRVQALAEEQSSRAI